jgi:hypothetical protein
VSIPLLERFTERKHIGETALARNVGDQPISFGQEGPGIFQSLAQHILVWRDTVDLFKTAVEMKHRHIALPGNAHNVRIL